MGTPPYGFTIDTATEEMRRRATRCAGCNFHMQVVQAVGTGYTERRLYGQVEILGHPTYAISMAYEILSLLFRNQDIAWHIQEISMMRDSEALDSDQMTVVSAISHVLPNDPDKYPEGEIIGGIST